ncbi:non-hydrolyzing UDP-N-acetylglucosamine 2-epimerase [Legionella septentrionalis]|uniref:UDP-N-acetylglucosamine 2-epimerase (non-hydrolyzing) n=1 Tax=Legionella septentrionalis TaxID=2498109 RepID=A0A3S0VBV7_9GAMM|nr:UDP-N-acetylglucosamine 2-epimerase (non-hydrolyzing) [Legionella septentrionalis]RUQ91061.1 UDP-N-acetylglucosamine 2-epimerase (non-hydrolyzing) [Legionella septentrionalis]RUR02870.1 UDP-N-acetylglucosamine 2-epimerase (non-hydrolyzing) [Legionella septentrionalis]RUR11468.1 UDP-N-acetylglucosamine 2-epimerase (non-hydrolyzing) [Legionella septentrionalis]RUR16733.1 UDP-N-acetylglucosamine 2-epimerase (non-hydrolyzing) [Legionella septentrionalis]
MKLFFIIGTRPEAIKLAPVINLAKKSKHFSVFVCNTGQHKEMLQQAFDLFDIKSDVDLNVMEKSQGNLAQISAAILSQLDSIISREKPDWILVQGDTLSAFAGGLVGFYNQVKVAHVEAGLRSFDNYHPFPEEVNRKLIATFSQLHFAPTELSKQNLLKENIPAQQIINTGNTVIDALLYAKNKIDTDIRISEQISDRLAFLDESKNIILLTAHRRENHQFGLQQICRAVKFLAETRKDIQFIFPVHLNPAVKNAVFGYLGTIKQVVLTEPLDYLSIVYLLNKSKLILTDSGGIQEEASTFSTPVLVMREKTERMEGIHSGFAKLVGTNSEIIIEQVNKLLDCEESYAAMCKASNPYGDGLASKRILQHLEWSHASTLAPANSIPEHA